MSGAIGRRAAAGRERRRARSSLEILRKERAAGVFMGEHELALGMTRYVLERLEIKKK